MPHIILCVFACLLTFNAVADDTVWEKVYSEGDTTAYVGKDNKSGLTQCKVETVTSASVDALVALNTDYQNLANWMETAIAVEQLQFNAPNDYVLHFIWDSPWPVKDRESVTHSRLSRNNDGSVSLKFVSENDLLATTEARVRIPLVEGFWHFIPQDSGGTKVVYQSMVDPGGDVPLWLVNLTVTEAPFKTVLNMHEQLQQEKYRTAVIDWL
jgi:hypothetical protein